VCAACSADAAATAGAVFFRIRMIYCNTLPYTLDWPLAKTLTPSRHSAHAFHGSERVTYNQCPPQAVQDDTSLTAITEPVIATAASRDITLHTVTAAQVQEQEAHPPSGSPLLGTIHPTRICTAYG
jgi:hypothetical protein